MADFQAVIKKSNEQSHSFLVRQLDPRRVVTMENMSSMMGRFSLSGNTKSVPTSAVSSPQPNSSTTSEAHNRSSMHSITMSSMNISSLTKKMGAGLNIASLTGLDSERKAKLEAEEKKNQITLALSVLEDVRLQCPQTHTGLVLAYTGTTLSPIINPGIKFTWFRMSGEDRIDQVEESLRAWYPPTVDDIGCNICAQCEDNFDQGCSRYVECGPIKADGLLCDLAESTVENGYFEAKDICVSLGLSEMESTVQDYSTLMQHHIDNKDNNLLTNLTTVLNKDSAFLQLDGSSTIEVDDTGVFISIPTFTKPSANNSTHGSTKAVDHALRQSTSRRGLRIPASTGLRVMCAQPLSLILVVPITRKSLSSNGGGDNHGADDNAYPEGRIVSTGSGESTTVDEVTGGKHLSVVASTASPLSRQSSGENEQDDVVSVEFISTPSSSPNKASRGGRNNSTDGNSNSNDNNDNNKEEDEEKMKRFLSSSIVAIPWTYEGHNHSPEAYAAEGELRLCTAEEREQALKSAEEDSIIFANTVCALAEFISVLPEGTDELMLCFSCTDRLVRDALALSIRSLAAQPSGCTRYERRKVFPWLSLADTEGGLDSPASQAGAEDPASKSGHSGSSLIGASQESEQDMKRRLRGIEEENNNLKRERNELTMQLLESREEVVGMRNNAAKNMHHAHNTVQHHQASSSASESNPGASTATTVQSSSAGVHAIEGSTADTADSSVPTSDTAHTALSASDLEAHRQLSSKVIELENKIAISSKREAESAKIRSDIESRNNRLLQDVEKYKKSSDESSRKLASLQTLYDASCAAIKRLEDEQARAAETLEQNRVRLRDMEGLQSAVGKRDEEIRQLRKELEDSRAESSARKATSCALEAQIEVVKKAEVDTAKTHQFQMTQLESQLSTSITEGLRHEREIFGLREKIKEMEGTVDRSMELEHKLKEAEAKADQMTGEVNAMHRKCDSLSRDLKKTMKESAMALAEFEKALLRKSEECNDLYFKINDLMDAESARAHSNESTASAFFQKISASITRRDSLTSLSGHNAGSVGGASGGSEGDVSESGSDSGATSSSLQSAAAAKLASASAAFGSLFRKNSVTSAESTNNSV